MYQSHTAILDFGSYEIRGGDTTDLIKPRLVIPSCYGRHVDSKASTLAQNFAGSSIDGILSDWDYLEKILGYIFNEGLKIDTDNLKVMVTEEHSQSLLDQQKMYEIFFEKFNVELFQSGIQGVLGLYATGRMTGLSVNCGHSWTSITPVYDGYLCKSFVQKSKLGGSLIDVLWNKFMQEELGKSNNISDQIKEQLGYVAYDYQEELTNFFSKEQTTLKLPDGNQITLTYTRFKAPEVLFNPSIISSEGCGISDHTKNCLFQLDTDVRAEFSKNIIVCGGSSLFPGFRDRMQKELNSYFKDHSQVCVDAPDNRQYLDWIGAKLLVQLDSSTISSLKRQDYYEGIRMTATI